MVKVRATKEGIDQINFKREEKRWAKNENSEVLTILSQNKFEQNIAKHKKDLNITGLQESIPIDKLKNLVIKLSQSSKEKLFDNSETFLAKLVALEEKKQKEITLKECLELIELNENKTRAPGINYANWQKFLRGKDEKDNIDINVFQAFCEALEIENWNDKNFIIRPGIYEKATKVTKETLLLEGLSLFNHQTQVNSLLRESPNPTGIFLIKNPCIYSQTWMLRRLVAKIKELYIPQCRAISLDTSHLLRSSTDTSIKDLFYNKDFSSFERSLNYENLIFTIKVDDYNNNNLNNFLEKKLIPLVDHLKKIQPRKPGKIFMFLLDRNQENDWYKQDKNIVNLPPNNIYTQEQANDLRKEVSQVLLEIAQKLNHKLSGDEEDIANDLINGIKDKDNQNNPERLLRSIYQHFKCRTTEFASIWQTYP